MIWAAWFPHTSMNQCDWTLHGPSTYIQYFCHYNLPSLVSTGGGQIIEFEQPNHDLVRPLRASNIEPIELQVTTRTTSTSYLIC